MIELNQDQLSAIKALKLWWKSRDRFFILEGEAGTGKAQPLDELVLTPEGFKEMGDINIGDTVYSETGKPIKVLDTFVSDSLDMYKINFTDGTSVRCCKDHLWEVQTPKLRELKRYKVMSLIDMLPNLVKTKVKHTNKYRIRRTKPVEFPEVPVKINSWELGYLLGNGFSFGHGLVCYINLKDSEELLNNFSLDNVTTHNSKWSNTYRISYDLEFKRMYEELGLKHVLSSKKFVPKSYLYNSIEVRKDLLAGILDSDGSCTDNKCRFSTGSSQLALDVQNLVEGLGGTAYISSRYRKNALEYTVQIRTPFNPFSLKRKALNYKVLDTDIEAHRSIVNAVYLGKFTGKCLLVDNPTHLYLTKNYIVTHNTTVIKYLIEQLPDCDPIFTACTNEACRQLELALPKDSLIRTTYSALGFNMSTNGELKELKQGRLSAILDDVNLLIIDECSMVGEVLFEAVRNTGLKVLFLGDNLQLPEVNVELKTSDQCRSVVFEQDFPKYTLNKNQRATGELYDFIKSLRYIIYNKQRLFKNTYSDNEIKLLTYIRTKEGKEEFLNETTKIICYSNKMVDSYNQEVRRSIFGKHCPDILPKDKIILTEPTNYVGKFGKHLTKSSLIKLKDKTITLTTNSKFEVKKVGYTSILGVNCHKLEVEGKDDNYHLYVPINKEELLTLDKQLKIECYNVTSQKAKENAWRNYHYLMSLFTKCKYSYALTTHRSQGMTIDKVFVLWKNMQLCTNPILAHKLLYVAASRARKELTIIG